MRTIGLFSGSGSLEAGLAAAGHHCEMLCEVAPAARRVLAARFPGIPVERDVVAIRSLPEAQLLVAGFPCQDVSLSGGQTGFDGARSGLVREIFRLLDATPVDTVLLENVSNLVRMQQGRWAAALVQAFEDRGYRWAYRMIDARAALPQRRERFFLVASRTLDPGAVLFSGDVRDPSPTFKIGRHAAGFYWTRGETGLGWAPHCTPPVLGGSAKGIPSGPAVLLPDGRLLKVGLRDAERLQGMVPDATVSAGDEGARWRIVGNAIAEPIAEWIGKRLVSGDAGDAPETAAFDPNARVWPGAAVGGPGQERRRVLIGTLPFWSPRQPLDRFLKDSAPLSERATRGFLVRAERGNLKFAAGFLDAVRAHLDASAPARDLFAGLDVAA